MDLQRTLIFAPHPDDDVIGAGGLIQRYGARRPLIVGPLISAAGFALFARAGIGGSYWTTFFPAITVLGLGMAITVAPLTTTAMTAVKAQHAGVASGVNNAVARVGGLVAIAVFGIILVRAFDGRVMPALDRLKLSPAARAAVDRELPRLAGADLDGASAAGVIVPDERSAVRRIIDESFVSAFRVTIIAAAAVALAAAAAGLLIR